MNLADSRRDPAWRWPCLVFLRASLRASICNAFVVSLNFSENTSTQFWVFLWRINIFSCLNLPSCILHVVVLLVALIPGLWGGHGIVLLTANDSSMELLHIWQKFHFLFYRLCTWLYKSFFSLFVLSRDVCSRLVLCIWTHMSTLSIMLWIISAASLVLYRSPASLVHTPATCSERSVIFLQGSPGFMLTVTVQMLHGPSSFSLVFLSS